MRLGANAWETVGPLVVCDCPSPKSQRYSFSACVGLPSGPAESSESVASKETVPPAAGLRLDTENAATGLGATTCTAWYTGSVGGAPSTSILTPTCTVPGVRNLWVLVSDGVGASTNVPSP